LNVSAKKWGTVGSHPKCKVMEEKETKRGRNLSLNGMTNAHGSGRESTVSQLSEAERKKKRLREGKPERRRWREGIIRYWGKPHPYRLSIDKRKENGGAHKNTQKKKKKKNKGGEERSTSRLKGRLDQRAPFYDAQRLPIIRKRNEGS